MFPMRSGNESPMDSTIEEADILPIATRKNFANLTRSLVQSQPVDNCQPSAPKPTLSLPASKARASSASRATEAKLSPITPISKTHRRKHSSKPNSPSKRPRDLLEPSKYNPTTSRREYHLEDIDVDMKDSSRKENQDPHASISSTVPSASIQSEISITPTSHVQEQLPSGTYPRIFVSQSRQIPPGYKVPPQFEKYLNMDRPHNQKNSDTMTTGRVAKSTPTYSKSANEPSGPHMNSVYGQ